MNRFNSEADNQMHNAYQARNSRNIYLGLSIISYILEESYDLANNASNNELLSIPVALCFVACAYQLRRNRNLRLATENYRIGLETDLYKNNPDYTNDQVRIIVEAETLVKRKD